MQEENQKNREEWWPRGAKARVAEECMLTHAQLHHIVRGHPITPRLAKMLADASGIPWEAWAAVSMGECHHPALAPEQWQQGATAGDPKKAARKKRKRLPHPYDPNGLKFSKEREKARRKRLRRYIREQKRLADDAS